VIASIHGRLQHLGDIDTNPEVGQALFLHTKLIVKEDSLSLYGFTSTEERELFETLLGVSGIGPKLALATLSYLSPDILRSAVVNNQPEVLAKVPGLGKKTAEKVVFNLKDAFEAPISTDYTPTESDTEVLSVLTTLGYSMVEAQAAIQSIPVDSDDEVEARVRLALKYFAKP
jgi:Holliday junction DNA helicase RuvA